MIKTVSPRLLFLRILLNWNEETAEFTFKIRHSFYYPSTWETEAEGPLQGQPGLHSSTLTQMSK